VTTSDRYRGWQYAPLRFFVWLVAAVYLGRLHYNNTLYDLQEYGPLFYVFRTISILLFAAFVYWNLFVVEPLIAALMWGVAAFLVGMVFVWRGIIDAGAEYHEAQDPLNRRKHQARLEDTTSSILSSNTSSEDD
jgi:hypothetical protein